MAPVTRRSNGLVRRTPARQPIPKNVLVELSAAHNKACMFCHNKEISERLYGKLYQLNDIVVHYFCILLSSNAVQNGHDNEGIWGFLLKDIESELRRGAKESCYFCKKKGATILCYGVKCRKIFHLPCGMKNGSMHQFYQLFRSFCKQHRVTQVVDLAELRYSYTIQCAICKDDVIPTPIPTSLWAPCCKRNAWFHRSCVQELALSAGYFFKCPLCNNVDEFKGRMLNLGIYIPSRDASWETVPNAFAELLERHSTCNATTCLCPHQEKRNYNNEAGSWEIILCHTCGSNGTHRLCSSIKCDQEWCCPSCKVVADKAIMVKKRRLELPNSGNGSGVSVIFEERLLSQRRENAERLKNAAQTNNDTILISDDDSNDSSVQCLTYIDPPRTTHLPIQIPQISQGPQISQMLLPIITGYSSMSTVTSRNTNPRRLPLSDSNMLCESIDLTSDDENNN